MMDIGSLLLGLALLLLVGFIIARPLLEQQGMREKETTRADQLAAERESLLAALRDLDFDHATGKISDEDYAPQRAQLVAEGVVVLKQLDALGSGTREGAVSAEDEIEQAIAVRRKTRAAPSAKDQIEADVAAQRKPVPAANTTKCPNCGTPVHPGDLFCAKCGKQLQPAGASG